MSDTPRTDAALESTEPDYYVAGYVDGEFARELERELAAAQAENVRLREALEQKSFQPGGWPEVAHIDYCDFCNYSRDYIAVHGHGETCVLYARAALAKATPP